MPKTESRGRAAFTDRSCGYPLRAVTCWSFSAKYFESITHSWTGWESPFASIRKGVTWRPPSVTAKTSFSKKLMAAETSRSMFPKDSSLATSEQYHQSRVEPGDNPGLSFIPVVLKSKGLQDSSLFICHHMHWETFASIFTGSGMEHSNPQV